MSQEATERAQEVQSDYEASKSLLLTVLTLGAGAMALVGNMLIMAGKAETNLRQTLQEDGVDMNSAEAEAMLAMAREEDATARQV